MIHARHIFDATTIAAAAVLTTVVVLGGKARGDERSDAMEGATAVIGQFTQAIKAGDAESMDELILREPGIVAFGTDKAERWVGHDQLMDAVRAQFASFSTEDIIVHDAVVRITPLSDGAYFSEVWDWKIKAGDQEMALDNLRVTGVLENREGKWQVAQFHVSMPVGGQAVAY